MKKFNIITLFLIVFFIICTSITSYAIDSTYLVDRINGKFSFSTQNETNRPQYADKSNTTETIDPLTGSLTLRQEDLVLPGKDGFDLPLVRYFNSSQADFYSKKADIAVSFPQAPINILVQAGQYLVTVETYDNYLNETYYEYFPYLDGSAAARKQYEVETLQYLDEHYNRFNVNVSVDLVTQNTTKTIPYYFTSEYSKYSYQRYRYDLGAGWGFSFPSVQIIRNNMNSDIETPKGLYFHTGTGAVYTVVYSNTQSEYIFAEADRKNYAFWESGGSVGGRTVLFSYQDETDTIYKFGTKGELLQMVDRLGNTITFTHVTLTLNQGTAQEIRSNVIKTITDSVGRVLTFNYSTVSPTETRIDIAVTVQNEPTLTLQYNKTMVNVEDVNGNIVGKEPVLSNFINTNNQKTTYAGDIDFSGYTYNGKSFYACYDLASVDTYLLRQVWYPYSYSEYDYEKVIYNLGTEGIVQGFKVTSRCDADLIVNGSQLRPGNYRNFASYSTAGDDTNYTGYPYYNIGIIMPEYQNIINEVTENDKITSFTYHNHAGASIYEPVIVLKNEFTTINSGKPNQATASKVYKNFFNGKSPELVETTVTGAGGSYKTYQELQYYNTNDKRKGLLSSVTLPMLQNYYDDYYSRIAHRKSYNYTYGEISQKTWVKDLVGGSLISENVSYTNGRVSTINTAVGTSSISYVYLSGTNTVTKKTTIHSNNGNNEKIEEYYTSATNYAFPSEIREYYIDEYGVEQYRSKTYTYYMMLGKIKTVTDTNGVTNFEYDNLGRLTKESYPVYSTNDTINATAQYKAERTIQYGTNTLTTVDYGRQLRTAIVYDVLRYRDVPYNNSVFFSANWSEYDGFGNLVVSELYDNAEGTEDYIPTKFYYDVQNQLQKVVDPLGNIALFEYDALNRLTKITDPYLNNYINEYETAVTSAGAKAKSYFMANGSNTKENIIEVTSDIYGYIIQQQQENIIEKFSYDLAGNTTSYTDGNNNLNSYGVTNSYIYDSGNRLEGMYNAKNEYTSIGYDAKGNILNSYVAGTKQFTKSYDAQGRMVEDKDQLNNTQTFHYDSIGRLDEHIDRNGIYSAFDYDNINNVSTQISLGTTEGVGFINENISPYGANTTWDIWYQKSGNSFNGSQYGGIQREFSPAGNQLINYAQYPGYRGFTEQAYDKLGRVTSKIAGYISNNTLYGRVTNNTYNKTRLEKVQLDGQQAKNTADSVNAKYEYYPDGKLKSVAFPQLSTGQILKSTYVYDELNRLESLTNTKGATVISKYEYLEYDNNGNATKTKETVQGIDKITILEYDSLNRLISSEVEGGKIETFSYDSNGNRKTQATNEILFDDSDSSYSYNELNRLYSVSKTENGVTVNTFNDYTAEIGRAHV